ncbi:MAG TPA: acetate/propionate family kinase [Acetobacteraceae bacterium]|nr:acetate/propionate family kinase [Acetobacteraceae bacterium]
MPGAILALNAGSSSIKFALFQARGGRIAHGAIEDIGGAPHFRGHDRQGRLTERRWREGLSHEDLLSPLLDWAESHHDGEALAAIGHRIVHGGVEFAEPVRIDERVLAALDRLIPLAPLHQPHNLAPIRAMAKLRPGLPQVACFDTAFHHRMPELASILPLPARYAQAGVRRYGFHGLSYEYIARRFAELDPARAAGRVIAAHLGNGASACAMRGGRSLDTSMGFTALDGLMMGTRCGAIDPGAVLHMMQQEGLDGETISDILYHRSGLLGVSGGSGDMRVLLESRTEAARFAVSLFAYRAAREIAALTIPLGGLDALIFTAGIGEKAAPVRAAICAHLPHLGITLDDAANGRHDPVISAAASKAAVRVIPTDEEAMIADHVRTVMEAEV